MLIEDYQLIVTLDGFNLDLFFNFYFVSVIVINQSQTRNLTSTRKAQISDLVCIIIALENS